MLPLPPAGDWARLQQPSDFQRLLVLRALKADRLPAALSALCEAHMGPK